MILRKIYKQALVATIGLGALSTSFADDFTKNEETQVNGWARLTLFGEKLNPAFPEAWLTVKKDEIEYNLSADIYDKDVGTVGGDLGARLHTATATYKNVTCGKLAPFYFTASGASFHKGLPTSSGISMHVRPDIIGCGVKKDFEFSRDVVVTGKMLGGTRLKELNQFVSEGTPGENALIVGSGSDIRANLSDNTLLTVGVNIVSYGKSSTGVDQDEIYAYATISSNIGNTNLIFISETVKTEKCFGGKDCVDDRKTRAFLAVTQPINDNVTGRALFGEIDGNKSIETLVQYTNENFTFQIGPSYNFDTHKTGGMVGVKYNY